MRLKRTEEREGERGERESGVPTTRQERGGGTLVAEKPSFLPVLDKDVHVHFFGTHRLLNYCIILISNTRCDHSISMVCKGASPPSPLSHRGCVVFLCGGEGGGVR